MKKVVISLLLLLLPLIANAYDFESDGVQYTVISRTEHTVEVAERFDHLGSSTPVPYLGDVVIPPHVINGGVEYTVIGIGRHAFINCISLRSVSLPYTLTYIGDEAFQLCTYFQKITIPVNVRYIGYDIFSLSDIKEITALGLPPAEASADAFLYAIGHRCKLYVPFGFAEYYRNAPEWSKFSKIIEISEGNGEKENQGEKEEDIQDDEEDNTNHEYVDLGLPSGNLWAKTNVGAENEYGYGNHYAFGETRTKDYYYLENYKWFDSMTNEYTKYSSEYSITLPWLLDEDDVATKKWGDMWHIPSHRDYIELREKCSSNWEEYNGVLGRRFIGPNGNSIFLPASGYIYSYNEYKNELGYYMTSNTDINQECILFYFSESKTSDYWINVKYQGYSVRPIIRAGETSVNVVYERKEELEQIFNIQGVRQKELLRGLNIIKLKNGQTKKILIK